jgi:hypothetical protein
LVRSPIVREQVFFSVVSETGRLGGGRLQLKPDDRGGSWSRVSLARGAARPLWAVVSSEPDMLSPATVGWPLDDQADAKTFDVPDHLLLDGTTQGRDHNQQVYRRARWLAAAYAMGSLALVVLLLTRRVRAADARLAGHLRAVTGTTERPPAAGRSGAGLVVAGLCVALGFVLVMLLALYRIGVG